jgi:hypothetical protein
VGAEVFVDTRAMFSNIACAISILSNGSRSGPGHAPAVRPCPNAIGNWTKPEVPNAEARSATIAATPGSLPMRNLVAISHAVAALTTRALFSSATAARPVRDKAVSPALTSRRMQVDIRLLAHN